MKEQIIISLTSWKPRLRNLPIVLDSIFRQTVKPDKIVLNLAYNEILPEDILSYLTSNNIEINYVEDTKVYKKFIPTLKKYPEACVINIDDDCIFPNYMIEDFIDIHTKYPKHPISGNRVVLNGMQCHCGCCSLTKYDHFGEWLECIDFDLMNNCHSSDITITYLANKNNRPYIRTTHEYFTNVTKKELSINPYPFDENAFNNSLEYLSKRFGTIKPKINNYITDPYLSIIIGDITNSIEDTSQRKLIKMVSKAEETMKQTYSYRLGNFIIKPFSWLKKKLK